MRKVEYETLDERLCFNYCTGYFHEWIKRANETNALIETDTGDVIEVKHNRFRFCEPYTQTKKWSD